MVDARGFSCPMPVVMVQKEVKKNAPDTLDVLVDNQCAVDNVTRFANNQGYNVSVKPDGTDFRLTLKK
jgi:tRNA 2-thiouridine synthesizing protein A